MLWAMAVAIAVLTSALALYTPSKDASLPSSTISHALPETSQHNSGMNCHSLR